MGLDHFRELWKDLALPVMIGLSLLIHFLLSGITLSRRWRFRCLALRALVWVCYSLSNVVVLSALGMISNELGLTSEVSGKTLEKKDRLIAFWAPMLTLLLGGPDSITAYSLEDNELWKRQLLEVSGQFIGTVIIMTMAWSKHSLLSFLSLGMLAVAFVKCAEKTYVLWMASSERLQESMQSPNSGPNYPKFMTEYCSREEEGYHLGFIETSEVHEPVDPSIGKEHADIVRAHYLFPSFRRLFADLILSDRDRIESRNIFESIQTQDAGKAFRVVEIELHFMYEHLHTKAIVLYSPYGLVVRPTVVLAISVIMGFFTGYGIRRWAKTSPRFTRGYGVITLVLLAALWVQEVCSTLRIFDTYEANCWRYQRDKIIEPAVKKITGLSLRRSKQPRFSNYMGQFCLLDFMIKSSTSKAPRFFLRTLKIEKAWYTKYVDIVPGLKKFIFSSIKRLIEEVEDGPKIGNWSKETAVDILRKHNLPLEHDMLSESLELEFDHCVLAWHIATEMWYRNATTETAEAVKGAGAGIGGGNDMKWSRSLSRYMVCLLVNNPTMLPNGISHIRIQDTEAEASDFFKGMQSPESAYKEFSKVKTDVAAVKVKGSNSKSVLFYGRRLETGLNVVEGDRASRRRKWSMIADIWFHMLIYAAKECRGSTHAKHLRHGGELLTQVWMLMAHFGLTDHFQLKLGSVVSKIRKT